MPGQEKCNCRKERGEQSSLRRWASDWVSGKGSAVTVSQFPLMFPPPDDGPSLSMSRFFLPHLVVVRSHMNSPGQAPVSLGRQETKTIVLLSLCFNFTLYCGYIVCGRISHFFGHIFSIMIITNSIIIAIFIMII